MSIVSTVAASTVAASPSIAATDVECSPMAPCSRPDLAARLDAFWQEWHWRWNLTRDASEDEIIEIEKGDDAFFNKEAAIVREISEMRVQTLADVILQARACALSNIPLWTDEAAIARMHYGERIMRSLVDSICRLHDIAPIPHEKVLLMDEGSIPMESAPPSTESGDIELLQLGTKLEAARAIEAEKWKAVDGRPKDVALYEEACEAARQAGEIVDRIECAPASTIEGLKVKGRALSWCYASDGSDLQDFPEGYSTDYRLARSILRDIERLNVGAAA